MNRSQLLATMLIALLVSAAIATVSQILAWHTLFNEWQNIVVTALTSAAAITLAVVFMVANEK